MLTDSSPTNLPIQLTSFIGRESEMDEIRRLLQQTRLLTLTGPGGCGKTRLAIQVAAGLSEAFADGVWFVELASLADSPLVPQAVASLFGVREAADRSLTKTLAEYLRPRKLLLVLDNCEHLVTACAQLAETLLQVCPNLRVLATSREALNIAGETVWLVPSLSLPNPQHLPSLENFAQYEAVRLFVDRARAVQAAFTLTQQNATAVAQVCYRLDGMPLALELAAARVKVLSVEQIAVRLNNCFRLLTAGSRTALPRHQTLGAAIDWSYDLLSAKEQLLFRRLSVFAGGFTLAAAEAVCAGGALEAEEVLDVLSHLVDKSLVVVEQKHEVRYRLLEAIRQCGQEKSGIWVETATLRQRHAMFFLGLAEEVEPRLNIPQRRLWLAQLDREHDNLRAALTWSLEEGVREEIGLRLAGALWWFWFHDGYWSEGRRWLEAVLARDGASGYTKTRAKALYGAGWLAFAQGEHATACSRLEESVVIWRELGNMYGLAYPLSFLSQVVMVQGDYLVARSLAEEAVRIFRNTEDAWGLALAVNNLANVLRSQDDAQARPLYEECIAMLREIGDIWALAMPLRHLGDIAFRRSDYDHAVALYKESLTLSKEAEEKWFISRALENLAGAIGMQGDYIRAVRLFAAAEVLRELIGAPVMAFYQAQYERALTVVRAQLDEETFAAVWAEGRAMPLEQVFVYALGEPLVVEVKEETPARITARNTQVPANLHIVTFGTTLVYRGEHALTNADWTYAKPKELFFYLLCHPPRTKGQIGLALWPDASPTQLRSNFHVTLHHLRQALGRPDWIIFENNRYVFNRHLPYWFDTETFEAKLAEGQRLRTADPAEAISSFEQAIKLYQGDFLQDFVEGDWYLPKREALRQMYLDALLTLGQLFFNASRYAQASDVYRQAIAYERYFEAAHRGLMRCYARMGERTKALRHYQTLLELLHDEFGSPPAAETTALYKHLRKGEEL